jgi:choline monooxygenase
VARLRNEVEALKSKPKTMDVEKVDAPQPAQQEPANEPAEAEVASKSTEEIGSYPIRMQLPKAGDASPRRYQEAHADLTTDYFWAFPNWMLNCYPDNVSVNIVLPIDEGHCRAIFEWYLPEKELGGEAAKASVRFSDEIQMEDAAICEVVQKNLQSRSYQRGRYSVKHEKGVHAFHRMYTAAMIP